MRKILWPVLMVALFLWSCGSDSPGNGSVTDDDGAEITFNRRDMLLNWADNIIVPSYSSFLVEFSILRTEFETFELNPTEENLALLREAWLGAYKSWQRISMFEIGPAEEYGLRLNINTYPTDTALVGAYAASWNYDFSLPSNRDTKGFPALDYLINGLGADDASIIAIYNTNGIGAAYLSYAADVIDDIETRVAQVRNDWNSGYRDTFINNDGSSATASVDRYVNDYILYYEKFLRAGKMGLPLGVFSGTSAPQTIEAFYSDGVSNELFLEGLGAVQDFFNGEHPGTSSTGESLASYLRALNDLGNGEGLDVLINNQFNTAREMVAALGSFKWEIENNAPPTDMLLAYDEVQRAVPLMKVDMVSAMSIAIDFVDADGD